MSSYGGLGQVRAEPNPFSLGYTDNYPVFTVLFLLSYMYITQSI